jgi:hypothetical protein
MIKRFVLLTCSFAIALFLSCKKNPDNWSTIKSLHKTYENGEMSECTLDGEKVYHCGLNAYDAGSSIYNAEGDLIGTCNYAWGTPDSICGQLEDCVVIYRVKDNIWGRPSIDKYDLGN